MDVLGHGIPAGGLAGLRRYNRKIPSHSFIVPAYALAIAARISSAGSARTIPTLVSPEPPDENVDQAGEGNIFQGLKDGFIPTEDQRPECQDGEDNEDILYDDLASFGAVFQEYS